MGNMCFEGCLLFQGTEGIRVDEECEEGTISQTVCELLAYFFIFFKGFCFLFSYPLVCGGISARGEGLHRSHGAGMVKNDIISII